MLQNSPAESISILIVTYNRPQDLLHLLQTLSVQKNTSALLKEVLILDNASTVSYNEVHKFTTEHPNLKIQYINSTENLGVARGRNKLMAMATGDWLLVIDDDILFTKENDLETISTYPSKELFVKNKTVVFAMRVLYYDTKEVQQTAFPHKKYEKYKHKSQFLSAYYIGCAHLMKRSVLDVTGLYPPDFFYGMEEYDLSYRILDAGYTIGYDASVTFEHKESPLGRQPNHKKLSMQWINKSRVAYRYLPFIYFLSTSFLWSFQYLKHTKGHLGTFIKSWVQVCKIPFTENRSTIKKHTLEYLRKVEARLWY